MVLGLKRGVVELADHDPEWEQIARETIERLWRVFGAAAKDIQHVGSTAIIHIKAKPIIDIAVAVFNFDDVMVLSPVLEKQGFICVGWENDGKIQPMYQCGEFISGEKLPLILTHFIHIVMADSSQWYDYINHRDYMNFCPIAAHEYESVKIQLAEENSNNYHDYFLGKRDYIQKTVKIAQLWNEFCRKFTQITPINKGWSEDKKYCVETADGRRMLLRVSDISEYGRKKAEYEMMERVYNLGVLTPQPLGFDVCDGGKNVYSLSGWLDGKDADVAWPDMSETNRYALGLKAGETLRKIHTLPAPDNSESWGKWFYLKVQNRIDVYNTNPVKSESGDIIVRYLQEHKHLLGNRPQTFNHGDYTIVNLIIMPDGQVGVIDFNAYNKGYGDPWWEFDPINWGNELNIKFYNGFIKGYFNGEPPDEFFIMLSYYLAYRALADFCDISSGIYGNPEESMLCLHNVLHWFDNMQNPVPSWYLKDYK